MRAIRYRYPWDANETAGMSVRLMLDQCEQFGRLLAHIAGTQLSSWTDQHLTHAVGWAGYLQGVMASVEPGSPEAKSFDAAMKAIQSRYTIEDPAGCRFISREHLELSVNSLQNARSELLRLLLGNRSASQELYKAALLTGLSTENGSAGKALKEVCVALMPKVRANATVRLLRVMESRCASSSDAAGSTCEGPSAMFRVPLSQTLAHVVAGRAHQWTTLGSNPHGGQASNLLRALFDQPFFWKEPVGLEAACRLVLNTYPATSLAASPKWPQMKGQEGFPTSSVSLHRPTNLQLAALRPLIKAVANEKFTAALRPDSEHAAATCEAGPVRQVDASLLAQVCATEFLWNEHSMTASSEPMTASSEPLLVAHTEEETQRFLPMYLLFLTKWLDLILSFTKEFLPQKQLACSLSNDLCCAAQGAPLPFKRRRLECDSLSILPEWKECAKRWQCLLDTKLLATHSNIAATLRLSLGRCSMAQKWRVHYLSNAAPTDILDEYLDHSSRDAPMESLSTHAAASAGPTHAHLPFTAQNS